MKWLIFLISPSGTWGRVRDSNWVFIPLIVGLVSALSNFYITNNPQVIYIKAETILKLSRDSLFTLPEGEGVIRLVTSLDFLLLPLWYTAIVILAGYMTKLMVKNIDYKKVMLISSLSILPVIPVKIILTWFLQSKGLNYLTDLRDLNLTLGPTVFSVFNRDMIRNDTLYLFLREINLLNIWSMIIFVSLLSHEKVSIKYGVPIFLASLSIVRFIGILWERYGYNIIWFFLVGG